MDDSKDAPARKRSRLTDFFLALLVIAALLGFTWYISTPEQQFAYLKLLGFGQDDLPSSPAKNELPPLKIERLVRYFETGRHGVGSACSSPGVANPSRAETKAIYKWVDESGQTHYSDKPSPGTEPEIVGTLQRWGNEDYSARFRFIGFKPNPLFQDTLGAELDTVFRFFENQLKIADLPPLHINLVVISGKKNFARYRNNVSRKLTTTSGFYNFARNEAVVRWTNRDSSLPVVRHEIAHLLIGNGFGDTPLWFNEGFAEIFEQLRVDQNALTATLDEAVLKKLARRADRGNLPSVEWLVASTREDWKKNGGQSFFYGYSWALVHYLLSIELGKDAILAYLRYQAENRCENDLDPVSFLSKSYQGGLTRLDEDFRRWLTSGSAEPLYY
jgi:hypothetical protein